MKIRFKNAQAALEFLTTYGWAFLVILVMIGALAYFGVLNPSKFLPNRCNFGSEFQCLDFALASATPFVSLKLKNNVGQALVISGVKLESETGGLPTCVSAPAPGAATFPMSSGNVTDVTFAGASCDITTLGLTKGDKGKVLITLTYYATASGSGYAKQSKGEVLATLT